MIELEDIQLSIKHNDILRGVSVAIDEGESVAIVGESGAGKSTLARVFLGLTRPSQGRYVFGGEDVASLRGHQLRTWRRNCQAVFQDPLGSLNPRLTIERSVTEVVTAHRRLGRRARRALAEELLETVGLDASLSSRLPHQLSGGQRQRVVIARAISTEPSVLVLDEPVSALDVSARAQVLGLLSELRRKTGVTLIYITHDLATVGYICDRVVVLYRGEVVEQMSTLELTSDENPSHPYTQALLDSVVAPDKPFSAGEMTLRPELLGNAACAFAHACPHTQPTCISTTPEFVKLSDSWSSKCHFADGSLSR